MVITVMLSCFNSRVRAQREVVLACFYALLRIEAGSAEGGKRIVSSVASVLDL